MFRKAVCLFSLVLLLVLSGVAQAGAGQLYLEDFEHPSSWALEDVNWMGVYNGGSSGGLFSLYGTDAEAAWVWHNSNVPTGYECLIYTNEYTVDTANYPHIEFKWDMRMNYNGTTPAVSVAVKAGGSWYVSKTAFVSSSRPEWDTFTLNYNPAKENWDTLDVNSASRGTGATSDILGNITGFGLYSDTGHVGGLDCTAEYDNFTITDLSAEFAWNPAPDNNAQGVARDVILSWSSGGYAASHDVYFGTGFNDVNDANDPNTLPGRGRQPLDANSYPCRLKSGQTYYWRIDEVNEPNIWEGEVWSFTVRSGAAWNPVPDNNAQGAARDVILSWSPGDYAASHDVYFGTGFNDVNDANDPNTLPGRGRQPLDANSYPCSLKSGQTYYWRIDVVNEPNIWRGEVWRFTAESWPDADFNGDGKVNLLDYAELAGAWMTEFGQDDFDDIYDLYDDDTIDMADLRLFVDYWPRRAVYYVDSENGNDSNSGTSPEQAWKSLAVVNSTTFVPGDKILLKAGGVWNNQQLYLRGSGSSQAPIIVDRYGTGADPVLNGQGLDFVFKLQDSEYIEVYNLEITNEHAGTSVTSGVGVFGTNAGQLDHIYLKNLYIHDINGNLTNKSSGGISVDCDGSTTPTFFNDLRIEDCTIERVNCQGIMVHNLWNLRGCVTYGTGPWTPHTNVVVRNCTVEDVSRDGIVVCVADSPLIEYSTCSYANSRSGQAGAGIWTWNCDSPTTQYCESYACQGSWDSIGFDCDSEQYDCLVQYCYSHDNLGGFMLMCMYPDATAFSDGSICRYNISQNDHDKIIYFGGAPTNCHFYNNTIYLSSDISDPGILTFFDWGRTGWQPTGKIENNIIYNFSTNGHYDYVLPANLSWDYNIFYGNHPASEPSDAHKLTTDPLCVNPGSGGIGLDTVDGYKLLQASPAIDSGMTIADNGGKDYWGNPVPYNSITDRGAHEHQGQADP